MSTKTSHKVLAVVTPAGQNETTGSPYAEIDITQTEEGWNVVCTTHYIDRPITEWTFRGFQSYGVAFNAASREAVEMSRLRGIPVHITETTTT